MKISNLKLLIGHWKFGIGISNAQRGFTIIELLVVAGILVISGGLIAGVIFNTLRGSSKSSNVNYVAQNGNYALSSITDIVNSSTQIVGNCNNTQQLSIELLGVDEANYVLSCSGDNVTMDRILNKGTAAETSTETELMDDSRVRVPSNLASCYFKCSQLDRGSTGVSSTTPNPYLNPLIEIFFEVRDRNPVVQADTTATSRFKTSVIMRNYTP